MSNDESRLPSSGATIPNSAGVGRPLQQKAVEPESATAARSPAQRDWRSPPAQSATTSAKVENKARKKAKPPNGEELRAEAKRYRTKAAKYVAEAERLEGIAEKIEAAALKNENADLKRRIAELEAKSA